MKLLIFFAFFFFFLIFGVERTYAAQEIIKPQITWQRSTEAQDKVVLETSIGSKIQEALTLPLDPNQTVFDNGVFTPAVNKANVPFGNQWASWKQYSAAGPASCGNVFELRHFQGKFNLPSGLTINTITLDSPYYTDSALTNEVPVNDNAYIFINGVEVKRVGTSYGAVNRGLGGTAPIANETDGWIGNGNLSSNAVTLLHSGENVIDIVAGEWCVWGGLGKVDLKLEVESKFPLAVPYFNQKDPLWGSQEYDHANSIGPFFCGTTLAQCGCAVTSAAMLLKYYGVDKSPNGLPTNPQTLNDWLKANGGFDRFGAIRWNSVASYSLKSNEIYSTQKIKWNGIGLQNDFNKLKSELNSDRPVILAVRDNKHFALSTGFLGESYFINDPNSSTNTSLDVYQNNFNGMRLYEKTNTDLSMIYISSPNSILISDPLGRKTGSFNGINYSDIPNSIYFSEAVLDDDTTVNSVDQGNPKGINTLVIITPVQGSYEVNISEHGGNLDVDFVGYDQLGNISVKEFSKRQIAVEAQSFRLDYTPEVGSKLDVAYLINIDIKPDDTENVINLKSNGLIPVFIPSTNILSTNEIILDSIKFGPNEILEAHGKGHSEDIDKDGKNDLILHFKTQGAGIKKTDSQICLSGELVDGSLFLGCDKVKIIN